MTSEVVYREFKRLLTENGIKGTLHQIRNTYATNNYYLGTPIKHMQMFLGHADVSLTLDIYTNIDYKISKEKIRQLYNNMY